MNDALQKAQTTRRTQGEPQREQAISVRCARMTGYDDCADFCFFALCPLRVFCDEGCLTRFRDTTRAAENQKGSMMALEIAPRVGYIGTGWTERGQIPAFTLGGLTAQAVASRQIANAERVASRYAIPEIYGDWRELVASPTVDVVSICSPPHLHKEMAIAALEAGKHVICEKPMAMNVAEAEIMFAAAQAHPDQLAIIDHEMRFHPVRLHLRQMIREGEIGHLLRVDCTRTAGDRLNPDLPWTWWADASKGGGMLGALGSHMLDLSRWLAGRIEMLTGQTQIARYTRRDSTGAVHDVTADDHADLLLHLSHGVRGRIVVSGITPGPTTGMEVMVTGDRGALRITGQDLLEVRRDPGAAGVWEAVETPALAENLGEVAARGTMSVGSYYLAQAIATALPLGESALPEAASFYDGLVVQRALDAVYAMRDAPAWVSL